MANESCTDLRQRTLKDMLKGLGDDHGRVEKILGTEVLVDYKKTETGPIENLTKVTLSYGCRKFTMQRDVKEAGCYRFWNSLERHKSDRTFHY